MDVSPELTETIWLENAIYYVKAGPALTAAGLDHHYARLAAAQPDLHKQGIDVIIYDFRETAGNMPYLTLISSAQKSRKQLDAELLKGTLRVFLVNSAQDAAMLEIWRRLTSRYTTMRICRTLEDGLSEVAQWRQRP